MGNLKSIITRHRKTILFLLILAAAAAVRMVMFGTHPAGLNQDEASIGYDAWALLKYGVDRNGCTLPVQLVAWGSGQNALYAYLSMPFIALFGLNVFSVRIVNLIFSLVTVAVVYDAVKRGRDARTGFIAMALTAVSPWNIMLARWGLESNLFPALLMLSIWALLRATEKPRFLYAATAILALSLYSYGAAYLVISVFALLCFVYFIIARHVPVRQLIVGALIYTALSVPIYLFMIVNVFELDTIKIGLLTIPRLNGNRIDAQSGATFYDFFRNFFENGIKQTDGYERNAFAFYGCLYVFSLPFWILGIYKCARSRKGFDIILLAALFSSVLLFGYYNDPNINRVNAIYMPLILLTAVGLGDLARSKRRLAAVAAAYAFSFTGFCARYFGSGCRSAIGSEFYAGLGEAIEEAAEISHGEQTVYITPTINMPYIYTLFYTQTPPQEYISTARLVNPGGMFEIVDSFSNYVYNVDGIDRGESGVYIVNAYDSARIPQNASEIHSFDNFILAVIS